MRRLAWTLMAVILSATTFLPPLPNGLRQSAQAQDGQGITASPILIRFQSAEQMRAYLADQAVPYAAYNATGGNPPLGILSPLFSGFGCMASAPSANYLTDTGAVPAPSSSGADLGGATGATGAADSSGTGGTSDVFSTTNIQEAGVDEADVVKSDGAYFYLISGSSVRIIQATPADQLAEVGRLDLPAQPGAFYLRGDTLIALTGNPGYGYWYDSNTKSSAFFINVADRTAPTLAASLDFDGAFASSRLINNKLYLVLTARPVYPYSMTPDQVQALPLEAWLPSYQITTADGATRSGDVVGWEDSYYPPNQTGYGMTAVLTIDVDNPSADFAKSAIAGNAATIYASTSALYLAEIGSGGWSSGGGWAATAVAPSAGAVSSVAPAVYWDQTFIHKFDLTGDAAVYVASGAVPGHLLNQYSLGESNDFLRVATSTGWMQTNGVYVLGEGVTPGVLDVMGKIENIAPGENLYSARFIGDRGFLVTFKKIDPLFTVDVSDPRNPKMVGQLKVPGYSEYIHLMDQNHLITIGKDAYDMGGFAWYQGVQLSIFDVTDFANPTLMYKEIIGVRGTESEALDNPKAFNYFGAKSALAIPISLAEGPTSAPSSYGQNTFNGLYAYNVTLDGGFQLLGRMSTGTPRNYYSFWSGPGSYTRGLFVGDNIYAATQDQVSVAPLAPGLTTTKTISIEPTESTNTPPVPMYPYD